LAKSAISKAVELNPRHIKAKLLLADIYLRQRDFALAQKETQEIVALQPENYQALLILGNAYMYQRNFNKAQETFETLIKLAPDNPAGYYRLGNLQALQRKNDLAMANFEKAMSINPRLVDVFTSIVALHADKKEFDKALKLCDEKIEAFKDLPAVLAIIHNLKGRLYLAQMQTNKAEESFRKALEANPNLMQPYYALANIYIMKEEQDKAIAQYKSLLEKNPKQAGPHMLLGTLYDMQKRFDLSEKHYREALKINPDFAPAANNLAYLLAQSDDNLDEALGLAQKAKENFADDPSVADTLGWIYYKKGLYDNARSEFEDSLAKLPDNATVHYHLGLTYYKTGDKDRTRELFEKALSLDDKFDGADQARQILSEL
jgi:putative PEP-CTERM system TPR-repeat lipoprotein